MEWNFQSKLAEFRTSAVSNKASWTLKEHLGLVIPISLPEISGLPVYLQSKVGWSAWSYKCWGRRSHRVLHPHPAGLLKNHQWRESWLENWELEGNKMDRFCWMWGGKTCTCFIIVFLCRRLSKPDNEICLHSPNPLCVWGWELHKQPRLLPRENGVGAPLAFVCCLSHQLSAIWQQRNENSIFVTVLC